MVNGITDNEIESILSRFDAENTADGKGVVLGKPVPDFSLADQSESIVKFSEVYKNGAVVLAFYPNDFTQASSEQLCEYRDAFESFRKLGVQMLTITTNSPEVHTRLVVDHKLPFRLLSDLDNRVTKAFFGAAKYWVMDQGSRGIFIVSNKGLLLHRVVEPVTLIRTNSDKILNVLNDMRTHKFL